MSLTEEEMLDAIQTSANYFIAIGELAKSKGQTIAPEVLIREGGRLRDAVKRYFAGVRDDFEDWDDGSEGETLEAEQRRDDGIGGREPEGFMRREK